MSVALRALLLTAAALGDVDAPPAPVDFARDVAPLLREHCVDCHGAERPKAGLQLDDAAAVLAGARLGAEPVVQPGDPDGSPLYARLVHADPELRMPADAPPLADAERELLRRWIAEGARADVDPDAARASPHWAYRPPERRAAPADPSGWARSDLDRWIAAGLRPAGLRPAAPADRATLARRLALDLTGLPPEPAALEALLADASDAALERYVDELLASPHYGEARARRWLDLARYADSNGYEKDERREHWRWRDWVIDAFNADMPFDRFSVEQLAGDLLPDATLEQRLATGFQRNTMTNTEGGTDPEEFRVAAVIDRTNTAAQVWLGSTLGCAQCHDHKLDPFSQREYYGLYAFFDQTTDTGNSNAPTLAVPSAAQRQANAEAEARIGELQVALDTWTDEHARDLETLRSRVAALPAWTTLRPTRAAAEGSELTVLDDGSLLAGGELPSEDVYTVTLPLPPGPTLALRLLVLRDPSLPDGGPGRPGHGNFVLSELRGWTRDGAGGERPLTFRRARADFHQRGSPEWPPEATIDDDPRTGWAIGGGTGQPHQLVLDLERPLYGPAELVLRIGQHYGSEHLIGRLRVDAAARVVRDDEPLPRPDVEAWLRADARDLDEGARAQLRAWHLAGTPRLAAERARVAELRASIRRPTALVLQERDERRATHVLEGGSFLSPGETVWPHVPAVLPPLTPAHTGGGPPDRLALARWLVDPAHPLTARVTVNRLWEELFGQGLVLTSDDFGSQGEPPSHPELLDHLALRLIALDWSQKAWLREVVLSATYAQSSRVPPEARARDPDDVLLSRGARRRLPAEALRDVALAASGLLDRTLGGPSVFPPQPVGTWAMTYSGERWTTAEDTGRWRRGLYTFWRRTAPYPTFQLFDAPSRELSCARRGRTNTPLQALALLNDPAFFECAVALGDRMRREGGAVPVDVVERGLLLALSRPARDADERARLVQLFEVERAAFADEPAAAEALLAGVRTGAPGHDAPADERAAWAVVANVLLNLDEAIVRP